jgi:hypothetical protein
MTKKLGGLVSREISDLAVAHKKKATSIQYSIMIGLGGSKYFLFIFAVLGIQPRASCVFSKHSTISLILPGTSVVRGARWG